MMGSGTAMTGGDSSFPPPGWARLTDRLMAKLRARSIDDALLNGVPDRRPMVLVRRAQLLQRRYRSAVADSLRGMIDAARRNQPNFFAARLQLKVAEVLASEPLILTLADELEKDETVSPRGVILADRLITDGDSPIYGPTPIHHPPEETVESAVKHARAALYLG
jgi:hypothetical protein